MIGEPSSFCWVLASASSGAPAWEPEQLDEYEGTSCQRMVPESSPVSNVGLEISKNEVYQFWQFQLVYSVFSIYLCGFRGLCIMFTRKPRIFVLNPTVTQTLTHCLCESAGSRECVRWCLWVWLVNCWKWQASSYPSDPRCAWLPGLTW